MNGKKAKALRRAAEAMTVGQPDHDRRFYAPAGYALAEGDPETIVNKVTGRTARAPIMHHHASTRSTYRRMKRGAKA